MTNGMKPGGVPPQIQITAAMMEEATTVACVGCGCTVFVQDEKHHQVKKIPGLLMASATDRYVFEPVRFCAKCFLPIENNP